LENRLKKIIEILDTNKAENIDTIDLTNKNYIVDQVIISTALNTKHSIALSTHLKDELQETNEEFFRIEEDGDWSVIDLGDIVIHIMTQSHRDKYDLEDFLSSLQKEDNQ
jgi:ribosome-associated protein